jgi:chain length determinant protein EpsF
MRQFLIILWARKWLALLVLVGVPGITLLVSLIMPKTYVAETAVIVSVRNSDPVSGNSMPSIELGSEILETQVDVIASHNVALRVVDALKVADAPAIRSQFLTETQGTGSVRDWAADELLKRLKVAPSPESNVVTISYTHRDPQIAAALANAFADAYLAANLDLTIEPAKREAAWFQDQLAVLRNTLDAAQHRLAEYQQQQSLVGLSANRIDVENARYAELSSELAAAQGVKADTESRLKRVQEAKANGELQQLPDVLNSALMQSLKADLAHAEAQLAEHAQQEGTNHPTYLAALAQVTSLRRKLSGEMDAAIGSIRQANEIAAQRMTELQNALAEQKARILGLQQQNDAANVLTQEVQNAQRAYDAAVERAGQIRLESQRIQTSVAVLNPAVPPNRPTRPRVLLNVLIAMVLGVLLSIVAAMAAELFNRRVRLPTDLVELAGLPLLAQIPLNRPLRISRVRA